MSAIYSLILCSANKRFNTYPLDDIISYYDLTFLISGQLHYTIDGLDICLKGGDAILIPPGSHRVRYADAKEVHYFSINFTKNTDEPLPYPVHIPGCVHVSQKELLSLLNQFKADRSSRFSAEKHSLTLQLILLLLQESIEQESRNPYVNEILHYIQEHFTEQITLEQIAEKIHLTVPYCCNLVKQELGTTIYKIILKERLLLAQDYLLQGEKSLQEISYLCGFNDYSHFSKSFKKFTGVLPSQYRL